MVVRSPFRHSARVEMHLPGGFTRVVLLDLSDGGHWLDIPTDAIPLQLRRPGSRFAVVVPRFTPEPSDSEQAVREMCRRVRVEEADAFYESAEVKPLD